MRSQHRGIPGDLKGFRDLLVSQPKTWLKQGHICRDMFGLRFSKKRKFPPPFHQLNFWFQIFFSWLFFFADLQWFMGHRTNCYRYCRRLEGYSTIRHKGTELGDVLLKSIALIQSYKKSPLIPWSPPIYSDSVISIFFWVAMTSDVGWKFVSGDSGASWWWVGSLFSKASIRLHILWCPPWESKEKKKKKASKKMGS